MKACPCGSGNFYENCCELLLSGKQAAATPEQLMRSRYAAYSVADIDYIARTMRGEASIGFNKEDAKKWAKEVTWLGLKVMNTAMHKDRGSVEFVAYYAKNGQKCELHERSEFQLIAGLWYYTQGAAGKSAVGRNELCLCGSNKKYKKCCGMNNRQTGERQL